VEEEEVAIEEEGGTEAEEAIKQLEEVAAEVIKQLEEVVVADRLALQVLLDHQAPLVKMGKTEKMEKKVKTGRLDQEVLPEKKDHQEKTDLPDRKARRAKRVIQEKTGLPDQMERRAKTVKMVHLENLDRWAPKEILVSLVINVCLLNCFFPFQAVYSQQPKLIW
jgi:hypothetical protein